METKMWTSLEHHAKLEVKEKVFQWLGNHFEEVPTTLLLKNMVYDHYCIYCRNAKLPLGNRIAFGRMIQQKYASVMTRRLGKNKNNMNYYDGIDIKASSNLHKKMFHGRLDKTKMKKVKEKTMELNICSDENSFLSTSHAPSPSVSMSPCMSLSNSEQNDSSPCLSYDNEFCDYTTNLYNLPGNKSVDSSSLLLNDELPDIPDLPDTNTVMFDEGLLHVSSDCSDMDFNICQSEDVPIDEETVMKQLVSTGPELQDKIIRSIEERLAGGHKFNDELSDVHCQQDCGTWPISTSVLHNNQSSDVDVAKNTSLFTDHSTQFSAISCLPHSPPDEVPIENNTVPAKLLPKELNCPLEKCLFNCTCRGLDLLDVSYLPCSLPEEPPVNTDRKHVDNLTREIEEVAHSWLDLSTSLESPSRISESTISEAITNFSPVDNSMDRNSQMLPRIETDTNFSAELLTSTSSLEDIICGAKTNLTENNSYVENRERTNGLIKKFVCTTSVSSKVSLEEPASVIGETVQEKDVFEHVISDTLESGEIAQDLNCMNKNKNSPSATPCIVNEENDMNMELSPTIETSNKDLSDGTKQNLPCKQITMASSKRSVHELSSPTDNFPKWQSIPSEKKERYREDHINWLESQFEVSPSTCMPRNTVYELYCNYCTQNKCPSATNAIFGKMLQQAFPNMTMRRLGSRGCSKYYYMGVDVQENSELYDCLQDGKIICPMGKPKVSRVVNGKHKKR